MVAPFFGTCLGSFGIVRCHKGTNTSLILKRRHENVLPDFACLHAEVCLFFQTFYSNLKLEKTKDVLICKLPTINLVAPLLSVFGDVAWIICFQQLYSKFEVEKTVFISQTQYSNSIFKKLVSLFFVQLKIMFVKTNLVWEVVAKDLTNGRSLLQPLFMLF